MLIQTSGSRFVPPSRKPIPGQGESAMHICVNTGPVPAYIYLPMFFSSPGPAPAPAPLCPGTVDSNVDSNIRIPHCIALPQPLAIPWGDSGSGATSGQRGQVGHAMHVWMCGYLAPGPRYIYVSLLSVYISQSGSLNTDLILGLVRPHV